MFRFNLILFLLVSAVVRAPSVRTNCSCVGEKNIDEDDDEGFKKKKKKLMEIYSIFLLERE